MEIVYRSSDDESTWYRVTVLLKVDGQGYILLPDNTDVIYDFAASVTEVATVPVMGDHTVKARTFRASKVAGSTQVRYDINVNVIKETLTVRLRGEAAITITADQLESEVEQPAAPLRKRRRRRKK